MQSETCFLMKRAVMFAPKKKFLMKMEIFDKVVLLSPRAWFMISADSSRKKRYLSKRVSQTKRVDSSRG